MTQLRQEYQEFVNREAEILVIGPDSTKEFQKYWEREDLPFPGLPDPKHTVSTLYGQEVKLLKLGRMPAQVIVDKQGIIRFAHYGDGMQDIPEHQELLDSLDQLEQSS